MPKFCMQSNTFQIPSVPGVNYFIQSQAQFIDLIDRLEDFKLRFNHGHYDLLYIVAGIFHAWQSLAVYMSPKFPQLYAQRFHKLMGLKGKQHLTQSDRIATISLIFKVKFHEHLPENANTSPRPPYVYGNGERYLPPPKYEQNSEWGAKIFGPILAIAGSR